MQEILSQPLVAIILLLGLLVFVHEFGHYIFAIWFGVGVETFSIGFGPKILGFKYKDTLYQISIIPLGGFVKLAGATPFEEVPHVFRGREMSRAPRWGRALILLAGPGANLLLAAVVYAFMGISGIDQPLPVVGQLRRGSPAELAGLRAGDKIISLGDQQVQYWQDIKEHIQDKARQEVRLTYERGKKNYETTITPLGAMIENHLGHLVEEGRMGIAYGIPAAIITVDDPKGLAAQWGLETGDEVVALDYTVKEQSVKKEVRHLPDLQSELIELVEKQGEALQFQVKRQIFLEEGQPPTDEFFVIEADMSALPLVVKGESQDSFPTQIDKILDVFGLKTSGLTIGQPRSMAEQGLKWGDQIVALGGKPIADIFDLEEVLRGNKEQTLPIKIKRQGVFASFPLNLKAVEYQKASGKEIAYMMDVGFLSKVKERPVTVESYSLLGALSYGLKTTWDHSLAIIDALAGLFTGKVPLQSLGGPILIAKVAGDSARAGLQAYFSVLAMISINLGIINLFPIPILDGGQLCLLAIESIRRRPLTPAALENFYKIGFVMVMSLIVLAMYNDLSRFWSSMLKSVMGFF